MGYFNSYYIINVLVILVYPIHRYLSLNAYNLFRKDGFGFTYESSIVYTMLTILSLNYIRSYSFPQFASQAMVLLKVMIFCFYTFIDLKYAGYYLALCSLCWIFVSYPKFKGNHKLIQIKSQEEFNQLVKTKSKQFKDKKGKKKQESKFDYKDKNMWIVQFYVNWALTCVHSKQIWAQFSLKYTTDKLKFGSINLQKLPEFAETYSINTSGFSRQLPTVIIFQNGQEVLRFPPIDQKTKKIGKVLKYESKGLAKYFDLQQRYLESRITS